MVTQTRPEGKARSFGENIESDLASRFPSPPTAMLVAGAALRSDEPLHRGDELFARIISVIGGKFPNARVQREPTSLAQARALAGLPFFPDGLA